MPVIRGISTSVVPNSKEVSSLLRKRTLPLLGDPVILEKFEQYLHLRQLGLRVQAMSLIREFSKQSATLDFASRKHIVAEILQRDIEDLPYTLTQNFLEPTLREWTQNEPNDNKAWRWLGFLLKGPEKRDCLERALRLHPGDSAAQLALARLILDGAEHELHEAPQSFLGNSIEALRRDLDRVESYVDSLSSQPNSNELERRLALARKRLVSLPGHSSSER